jgi:hypothetical protein
MGEWFSKAPRARSYVSAPDNDRTCLRQQQFLRHRLRSKRPPFGLHSHDRSHCQRLMPCPGRQLPDPADGSGGVVDLRRFHPLITAHSNLTWRFSRLFGNSKRRNDRSDSSSPLNQINNQYDDCNYEEEMNQTAPNVTNEAKQPKHDQNNNYSPEHG